MFEISKSNDLEPVPVVKVLLLALIRATPDSSGYDLMKGVLDFTSGTIELSSGTVYSELRRLEKNTSVTSYREATGRRRRSYSITERGEKELLRLVAQIENRVKVVLNPLVQFVSSQEPMHEKIKT